MLLSQENNRTVSPFSPKRSSGRVLSYYVCTLLVNLNEWRREKSKWKEDLRRQQRVRFKLRERAQTANEQHNVGLIDCIASAVRALLALLLKVESLFVVDCQSNI